MNNSDTTDYVQFDRPEVLAVLFHPRPEVKTPQVVESTEDFMIPVEKDVKIGARFHLAGKAAPSILFFHGNGEIVADYDDMGSIYRQSGINFMAADYRGYGRSTGTPSVSSMMKDSHVILEWIRNRLATHGHEGPLIIMGRSLGSAPALELAAHHGESVDGLIIESGFSHVTPLLELLGIRIKNLGISEKKGSRNIDKIKAFRKPTLIIHAEYDHIIPFAQGQALYDGSEAEDKQLLKIPDADHNTIFHYGMPRYMKAVKGLVDSLRG